MKGLKRLGMVALLALLATIPALADKASSLYDKARDAEARQNYEQAYDLYKQAYDLKPKDLRYRTAYERTKLYAAAAKVHRGQMLRDAGKLADALAEFEAARQIDPSNFVAQQEAQRTRKMLDDVQRGVPVPQTDLNKPKLSERVLQAATPVELAPISQTPITLKLVEDSKAIYETI
ncbi:MAG TPA: type II and III secretion system protein, partial [Terriglobales bacterium]